MEHAIVSLEAPDTNWTNLVRFVERSGQPLWLEADGAVHGVLLPIAYIRRLMVQLAGEPAGVHRFPGEDGELSLPHDADSHLTDDF